jgi:AbrB family looped-hinge helix DNA binding protein
MTTARVSDKGQITLPADIRRRFGLKGKSMVRVEASDEGILILPIRSVRDVRGIFHEAALKHPADWETVREETLRMVAEQVAAEGLD